MPNDLTGDFEVVLQMSGKTANRLLASMHQNAFSGTALPTVPSRTVMRLGDAGFYGMAAGVRGTSRTQIGAPAIELIHKATDELFVTAPIRTHFVADPAGAPFPEFIHGRVRAKYRLAVVPASFVLGSTRLTYLALTVDPSSISFTSFGDPSQDTQITEQVRVVIENRWVVKPHPLLADFTARRFRSLVGPGGEAAICHPLNAKAGAGDIATVRALFLGGRDFAVAVSREYVLGQIQPSLDALKTAPPKQFTVTVKFLGWTVASGTYTITVSTATAKWSALPASPVPGFFPVGVVTLDLGGSATTPSWKLPNASFSVTHDLWVLFDPATETLSVVSSGPPAVAAHVNGPFGGLVRGRAKTHVTSQYTAALASVLTTLTPKLQASLAQKSKMIQQLQTLDAKADARFDAAESSPHGFVLRGVVRLTPRHMLWVQAEKLDDDAGYTAFPSWIPGGHIYKYEWHWYFQTTPIPVGAPPDGSQSHDDRFLLRSTAPVPGIPFYSPSGPPPKIQAGQLCLTVRGRVVDAVTGDEVGADNATGPWRERACIYLVPPPPAPPLSSSGLRLHRARQWWTLWLAEEGGSGADTADERVAAYVEATGTATQPSNTLVHYVGDEAAVASLTALSEGVRAGVRPDTGLLVGVVLGQGLLGRGGRALTTALTALTAHPEAALMVTEDVRGGWSAALGLPGAGGGAATRLVDTGGVQTWAHDGLADGEMIAAALREHLQPCPPPRAEPVELSVKRGEPAPPFVFESAPGQWTGIETLRGHPVTLAFVQTWARPSIAQLRRLQRLQEQLGARNVVTLALLDGADSAEAQTLAREHGLTFVVSPDRETAIARRFGVRIWPTTVTLDESGRVVGVDMGADAGALASLARQGGRPPALGS